MTVEFRRTQTVVVGSGVAGLSTALTLGNCLVVTKNALGDGSSHLAQGGIAAAVGPEDHADSHAADTVTVAAGMGDPLVAEAVTAAAGGRIEWLIDLGAEFDRSPDGDLRLGREAGHSARRIVHANGDATGAEVMRALRAATRARADIEIAEGLDLVDLLLADGRVAGILALDPSGRRVAIASDAVVLATGGIGQVYARTTNPPEVTGDGLAVAARAGARLADLEFVQFHPTALAVATDPVPLLTEALRGDGAVLIDDDGHRFMGAFHPDLELAPRDVVARAIWSVQLQGRKTYLDGTEAIGASFPDRFPTVYQHAVDAGFDPRRDPLPVTPAAHYHMGGIATDLEGRSSLAGLWAVGEVTSTGLHGANRLASNSLLEGMVLAARAADSIRRADAPDRRRLAVPDGALEVSPGEDAAHAAEIRSIMWERVGLARDEAGLSVAQHRLEQLAGTGGNTRDRNLVVVGRLVTAAALARTESRGSHHRTDHPETSREWAHRSFVTPEPAPTVELAPSKAAV